VLVKRLLAAGSAILWLAQSAAAAPAAGTAPDVQRQLREANETFTFSGEPIHPLGVKELLPWVSDSRPGPVAVDVAGTYKSNRYFGEYSQDKEGRIAVELKPTDTSPAGEDKGSFIYKRLGTLASGAHVLEVWENDGGSGVFTSLLLVRFLTDYEYDSDGARHARLVMMRVGEITLGDRYSGRIEVKGNTVRIGTDRKKQKVFRFD
jgi:hypothetical protein